MSDSNDDFDLYGYVPNKTLPIVCAAIFFVLLGAHGFLTYRGRVFRLWWAFLVGLVFEIVGYAIRRVSAEPDHLTGDDGLGWYVISTLLIILAPALFAASMYMTFGRLVRYVGEQWCPLRSTRITMIFVTFDVISFILQGSGGGMLAGSPSPSQLNAGRAVLLLGFAVQIVAFTIFLLAAGLYHRRVVKSGESELRWTQLLWALYAAGIFILIRSIFRMVEFAQGNANTSAIQQHEVFFYTLEALPIFIAVIILLAWHPIRFLPSSRKARLRPVEDGQQSDQEVKEVA